MSDKTFYKMQKLLPSFLIILTINTYSQNCDIGQIQQTGAIFLTARDTINFSTLNP